MIDPNIKQPPHSNEAEQSVLGAVMMTGIGKVAHLLTEDDFYREVHRLIWRACSEIDAAGERCDAVTVGEWFQRQGKFDKVDNGAYLTMLANETPGPANMTGYAKIVRQKSILRGLIELSADLGDRAFSGEEPSAIVSDMTEQLLDWTGKDTFTGPKPITQFAAQWLDDLDRRSQPDFEPITTGLVDVDRGMMGMMPSDLIILAGRPGSGKTAGALQIAEHVSRTKLVQVFSLEMAGEQLVARAAGAGVPVERLRDPKLLTKDDHRKIREGLTLLKGHKLIIDDTAGLHINQITARARYTHRKHETALIVIDYLQLIQAGGENRTNEISQISRALKKLAKDLAVPVIAVSQLNRSVESRPNKRPMMSDLRESGQLEQDADQIIFLYRHAYYHEGFDSNVAEWIRAKHRDGPTGTHHTMWLPEKTKFANADHSAIAEYKALLESEPATGRKQSRFQKMAGGAA
ncbi:MAG: replicative DNA helicase [Dichotomicrobium sp.]